MLGNTILKRRALLRSGRRLFSAANFQCGKANGTGLVDGASDDFFTSDLNIAAAATLVSNSDKIFRTAIAKDVEKSKMNAAQYLGGLKNKAKQYMEAEAEICGRAAICADIKESMLEKGTLLFVTGGRSVGKSKIMRNIVKAINSHQLTGEATKPPQRRVSLVHVDGRDESNLVRALSNFASPSATLATKFVKYMPILSKFMELTTGIAAEIDFRGVDFAAMGVAEAVKVLANKRAQDTSHTVLILDEANLYLECAETDAKRAHAKTLYNAVVKETKQMTNMSVVLVSSDEGLPYHLLDLGLSPNHITSTLVVSEPTPQEAWDLLQTKLGVGEHLSSALLDCYGGNVYQMCMFLSQLPSQYDRPEKRLRIFMGPAESISNAMCTWTLENKGKEAEILAVLEELARTGFVPIQSTIPLARLLTKFNVCAFLTADAKEYQVPEKVRDQRQGLIPASQLIRVLIAWQLEIEKGNKTRQAGK